MLVCQLITYHIEFELLEMDFVAIIYHLVMKKIFIFFFTISIWTFSFMFLQSTTSEEDQYNLKLFTAIQNPLKILSWIDFVSFILIKRKKDGGIGYCCLRIYERPRSYLTQFT